MQFWQKEKKFFTAENPNGKQNLQKDAGGERIHDVLFHHKLKGRLCKHFSETRFYNINEKIPETPHQMHRNCFAIWQTKTASRQNSFFTFVFNDGCKKLFINFLLRDNSEATFNYSTSER